METNLSKNTSFKFRTPVLILSVIFLVFSVLANSDAFIIYSGGDYWYPTLIFLNGSLEDIVYATIGFLVCVAPSVLFMIYALGYSKNSKDSIFAQIALGIMVYMPFWWTLWSVVIWGFSIYQACISNFHHFIFASIYLMLLIFWKKNNLAKIFAIIAVSTLMFFTTTSIISGNHAIIHSINEGMHLFVLSNISYILSDALFGVILILCTFGKHDGTQNKKTPQEEIVALNELLLSGRIGQEEYNVRRADILRKI